MSHQYVKAGPASKIASQVRDITLSLAVSEGINSFIDALLYAIINEIATHQSLLQDSKFLQPKITIDSVSPVLSSSSSADSNEAEEINYPITTESFKKASLSICGRNNLLAREAILEAELLVNDWIQTKGKQSDPAISNSSYASHAHNHWMGRDTARSEPMLAIPPFTRRSSSKSVSTLHSISDVGEDEDEEDLVAIEVEAERAFKNERSYYTQQIVHVEEYVLELESAIELISPLGMHTVQTDTVSSRHKEACRLLSRISSSKYTTPLLVIYASTFLNHIACAIIRGIADIVEMSPRITEAPIESLNEYMMSDDRVRILWSKLQIPASSPSLRLPLKSSQPTSLNSSTARPRSKSDIPHRFLSLSPPSAPTPTTTTTSDDRNKTIKRLSIDSELAQAHSEIIKLSRASPIERDQAAESRRLSIVSITSGRDRIAKEEWRKMEGEKPVISLASFDGRCPDGERDHEVAAFDESAMTDKRGEMESLQREKEQEEQEVLRAASSLSYASSSGSLKRGFSMLSRRASLRMVMREGKSDEGDIQTAEERSRRRRDGRLLSSGFPFQAFSSSRGSVGHKSSSSMSMSTSRGGSRVVSKKSGSNTEYSKNATFEQQHQQAHQQQAPASAKGTGRTSFNSSQTRRRLSEEPDFEDLIMRGDTLRMTLTPSRFRQPSKDGSSNETPRRVHGSATALGHARKYSLPGRARGLSNGSTSNGSHELAPSTALSPLSACIKLKARSAVAPKLPFEEDDTESSNTEREMDRERDDNVEELELDSEDETILASPYKQKRNFTSEKRQKVANKKNKESLFDILNSKPPWEDDLSSYILNGKATSSKAQKLIGNRNALTTDSSSASRTLQASQEQGPKKFAPIANLSVIHSLGSSSPSNQVNPESRSLDERVSHVHGASNLLATPSIPDNTRVFTTTSMDGQSDFFSSKASFALTRKEFPLPPQYQQQNGVTPLTESTSHTSNRHSPNRLNSYKSSPDLGVRTSKDPAMGMAGSSTISIPTSSAVGRAAPVRRLEAKDERTIAKRVNNDLMDFLNNAGPPLDNDSGPSSFTDLPSLLPSGNNRNTSTLPNGANGKGRLGSVNFRSLMGRGSKRPSTAPSPVGSVDFSKASGISATTLQAVDELGHMPLIAQGAQVRTTHSSSLNLARRKSESKEPLASLSNVVPLESSRNTGSVPPTAYLAHTAHRQNIQPLIVPGTTSTTTTMIMTDGHAASPISRQARNGWELAKTVEKQLELERLELERIKHEIHQREDIHLVELALIRDSYATFTDAQSQLTPKGLSKSTKEQRDTVPHPTTLTYGIQEAPLLTPENSRDDLYRVSSGQEHQEKVITVMTPPNMQAKQTEVISGMNTPPATPEEKVHSPHFSPLQSLPEDSEMRASSSSSSPLASASPSTVMPGMAHKHQRRLSAVRRKPSPKIETGITPLVAAQTNPASLGDPTNQADISELNRDASKLSRLSGLDPGFIYTPAAMLVDEYRGKSGSALTGRSSEEVAKKTIQAGQASVRSLASTVNSTLSTAPLSDLTHGSPPTRTALSSRSMSTNTTATSRPPSTVLLPLSPRHITAGVTGNKAYQAEIHDILLSLRNTLIAAGSVSQCLEIIDAALFEIAYETTDCHASSPSIIEEEEVSNAQSILALEMHPGTEKTEHVASEGVKDATRSTAPVADGTFNGEKVRIVEVVKLRPRTSRYVNRAFNAIIEYHLAYPSPPSVFPLNYHRLPAIKTYAEPLPGRKEVGQNEKMRIAHDKAPSLGYSVGDSASTESEDGVLDKTSSDTTLVGETGIQKSAIESKGSMHSKNLSLQNSEEEEEEVLQKANEVSL